MNHRFLAPALAAACLTAFTSAAQASCGSAFCSINTDWTSDTLGAGGGSVFDLRYENIRQDQPRTGSRRIAVGEIPHHHDEVHTFNQNLVASYSRNFESGWGWSLALPMVDRDHLHIHNHQGVPEPESWKVRELGDLRVTGRYQMPWGDQEHGGRAVGVVFGVKLPTGRTKVANDDGELAERSLQPGTGTTDAILGAFVHQELAAIDTAMYAQVQYQHPLDMHAGFAPGGQLTADLGFARKLAGKLTGLLQLNAVVKQRDRGDQAEPADSGSRSLYLSPGLSYDLGAAARVYAFLQQPLHQSVNGVQLTASRAFTLGVSYRF